jgi:uncharacterized protein YdcH (DUF465 family)
MEPRDAAAVLAQHFAGILAEYSRVDTRITAYEEYVEASGEPTTAAEAELEQAVVDLKKGDNDMSNVQKIVAAKAKFDQTIKVEEAIDVLHAKRNRLALVVGALEVARQGDEFEWWRMYLEEEEAIPLGSGDVSLWCVNTLCPTNSVPTDR